MDPEWITAISTAVLALTGLGATSRWVRNQIKTWTNPGTPPEGEALYEAFEDVLRDRLQDPADRKRFRREFKDQQKQKNLSRLERWQRYLRRRAHRSVALDDRYTTDDPSEKRST